MIIKEILLNNFVCFINSDNEPITIKFDKGVNIFRASNGGGKSQLFNAFYWVLFNEVYITKTGWEKGYPIKLIPDALRYKDDTKNINISVTLKIEAAFHKNPNINVEYTFFRSVEFTKKEDSIIVSKNIELKISYLDSVFETHFVEEQSEMEDIINIIFPERLRKYMWFQGETIDELIDFNNPATLKLAVQTISYYPYYLQLYKIAELTHEIIIEKINAHDRASSTLSAKESDNIRESERAQENLKNNRINQEEALKHIEDAKEKVYEYKSKLNSFSAFPEIEKRIQVIEKEDDATLSEIKELETLAKNDLVNLWMLKGTSAIISSSINILNSISTQIQANSASKNPIPLKVPGNTYIQKMLDDNICYICEREAKEGSEAYKAIYNRLNENKNLETEYKEGLIKQIYLEDSYISLVNKPEEALKLINTIPKNISNYRKQYAALLQKRRENKINKEKVYAELKIGDEDIKKISEGAMTAKDLTSKLLFYKDEQVKFKNRYDDLKENEDGYIAKVNNLKEERHKIKKKGIVPTEYENSEPYTELLQKITRDLKDQAYEKLIHEIEKESNYLYQEYLKENTSSKGKIVIDRKNSSVGIEDNGNLITVSQGLTIAAEMSVINAILSLSAKKIGKSYPLIADAPSSVFSAENTQSYTKKIGDTFEQVIIMSKDYTIDDLDKLKTVNHISNIWLLDQAKIDKKSKDDSRANYKTYITKLK